MPTNTLRPSSTDMSSGKAGWFSVKDVFNRSGLGAKSGKFDQHFFAVPSVKGVFSRFPILISALVKDVSNRLYLSAKDASNSCIAFSTPCWLSDGSIAMFILIIISKRV